MGALADAIARDILRDRNRPVAPAAPTCFACGRSYSGGEGRFCSLRCRDAYDAGFPSCDTVASGKLYSLPPRGDGFLIDCAGCRRPFVSKGCRCCSTDCERKVRERQEIEATMAEVGMEAAVKRKCEQCGGDIPRWTGVGKARRETSKAARFCSKRCQQKAWEQSGARHRKSRREDVQKAL